MAFNGFSPDELAAQRHQFNLFNTERIYAAMSLFSEKELMAFDTVPLLLHRNFSGIEGIKHSPDAPCGIWMFEPKEMHTKAFNALFPDAHPEKPCEGAAIHSVALIGSLGTVAQTHKSDFDYVLFADKSAIPPARLTSMRRKLAAIERWLHKNLGVEVHFFIQDIGDFQTNRFGETDKENVGSALGRLFKDEFYRTAIWVAGKRPLWWVIPPGFPETQVEGLRQMLAKTGAANPDEYLDLGHILYVEPGEFFGAALWQMNKALGSPFKSLLKMGLLESYLFDPGPGLLCEDLKRKVIAQNSQLHGIDPYQMMFERASGYYLKQEMHREANLMKGAFLLKTGIMPDDIHKLLAKRNLEPGGRDHKIAALLHKWGWTGEEAEELNNLFAGDPELRFQSHGHIYKYFLDAYVRFSDWLKKAAPDGHHINAEDMTVLGRKLFTHFEQAPGKIHFVHDPTAKEKPPARLTLIREKFTEERGHWALYEAPASAVDTGVLKPVLQLDSLTEMLAWMVVNGVWRPGVKFQFKGGRTQYKEEDAALLLREMQAFFGPAPHYEPTREDYLSANRVVKAFIAPNFGLWESPKEIRRVDMVLLDSWGEFRRERMDAREALAEMAQTTALARRRDDKFDLKVVAPPSQNDPHLAEEFSHTLEKAVEMLEQDPMSLKKATLDLS